MALKASVFFSSGIMYGCLMIGKVMEKEDKKSKR